MSKQQDDKAEVVGQKISDADTENELDDQELDSISGGIGYQTSSPFVNHGKGGPVIHALGPKQDDPDHGGHSD
jgi:bacteriocin-like protein